MYRTMGGAGSREWLIGNVARYYLRSHIWAEWKAGEYPSRLYVRAHYHSWVRETIHDSFGGRPGSFDLIVLPRMAGMSEFARQVTQSEYRVTNGIVALEIDQERGDLCQIVPFKQTKDQRTRETL